ncbi:MAG: response regulator [Bdellovibrionales bacterium]|nr:response regulator [Bdellovibrionales bacterium]
MALKVLLADESSTIKKVFQLALQDYAVDVKSVNVGLDVVDVAESFQPDIVFADVLLQKKSGYEVSAELKKHPKLQNTPVVLMWSGFMELDEDKFQASSANGQLEKPFDVQGLRKVIQGLVTKTKTQKLSEFLDFPDMPEFEDVPAAQNQDKDSVNALLNLPENGAESIQDEELTGSSQDWDMESFDSIENVTSQLFEESSVDLAEEFSQIDLPSPVKQDVEQELTATEDFLIEDDEDDVQWVQKDISQYKIDADPDLDREDDLSVKYVLPEEDASTLEGPQEDLHSKPFKEQLIESEDLVLVEEDLDLDLEVEPKKPVDSTQMQMSEERLEAIIRSQSEEMIEKVVWKVVPDLASRIIERELDRLLSEKGL